MKKNGFTAIETMCAVGVVGALTLVAVMSYEWQLSKAQSKEAEQMIQVQVIELSKAMQKGYCTKDGLPQSIDGRYGSLVVGGTFHPSKGGSCLSGCNIEYKVNPDGVIGVLGGKTLVVDVLNNQKISKNDATTMPARYLPAGLAKLSPVAGDNCSITAITDPTKTEGGVSGTETGLPEPTLPGGGGSGGGESGGVDPVEPGGSTDPDGTGTPPDESGNINEVDLAIHVNSAYAGTSTRHSGYYIKNSINAYDAIVSHLKSAPTKNTTVKFIVYPDVAVVGDTTQKPAFEFDGRLPTGMKILIENNGYILGRGGDGVIAKAPGTLYNPDASYTAHQKAYRAESRGFIYGDMKALYAAQYPFPTNLNFSVGDEEFMIPVDDWFYVGSSLVNDGGDAIKVSGIVNIEISNNGVIGGGGGGGYAVYDLNRGQDSGATAYHGTGGAPFGKNDKGSFPSNRATAGLTTVEPGHDGVSARGGYIGEDSAKISMSYSVYTNKGKFHKAGCAFSGSGLRIKNGSKAKVLGNSNCPTALSF